jgi:hypothetical protein
MATDLSLMIFLITKGAYAVATLESASERIGVLESDITRYILDVVSRKDQTTPCFIEPYPFNEGRWCHVEKMFKEARKMTGAQAHSICEHLHGEVVA